MLAGTTIALVLAGCSSGAKGDITAITATDSACTVARRDLKAGANTFTVRNDGTQVTEVYVYAAGDRVVTEKENIGPGTSVRFAVDLRAGTYEFACKPGQKGAGIRQAVTVTGPGGSAARPAAGGDALLGAGAFSGS